MPVTLTKAELKKVLHEERTKTRTKLQRTKFMNKTRGIYTGQQNRLRKETENPKATLPYTLDELRELVRQALERGTCEYTGEKLRLTNLQLDHRTPIVAGGAWELSNLATVTQSVNWQKGNMTEREFLRLMRGAQKVLRPESFHDFKRRLSTGGKFLNNGAY